MNLSSIVQSYDPPCARSEDVYVYIRDNLEKWIEQRSARGTLTDESAHRSSATTVHGAIEYERT